MHARFSMVAAALLAACSGGTGPSVEPPSNLTYATHPAVYTVGTAITQNTPSSSGGAVTSYAVFPALPSGLSLNTVTGVISGTPTAVSATATYTVTATNSAGSTTASLNIAVQAQATVPPTGLSYSTNPAVYTVGAVIAPNTPSIGEPPGSLFGVAAASAGLALNSTTGVITGNPNAVTATAIYNVTANNAAGSTTGSLTITVVAQVPVGLSYSTNPAVYTVGTAIAPNTPSIGGGAVASYSVSPPLPAGLVLNSTTGVITGIPTTVTPAASYTVTASNAGGASTASLSHQHRSYSASRPDVRNQPRRLLRGKRAPPTPRAAAGARWSPIRWPRHFRQALASTPPPAGFSGFPTSVAATALYTITASNSGGSTVATLSITVLGRRSLNAFRVQHTATLLPSGKVLFVGGSML